MLVIVGVLITGRLLYSSVDRIIRHVGSLCLGDDVPEFAVIVRIRSAFLYGNNNFPSDNCEDFPLFRVVSFFFMLDVCKF